MTMEGKEEIEQDALDSAIYLVLETINSSDERLKALVAERLELRDWAEETPELDEPGRQIVLNYIEELDAMLDRQYRGLYIQGFKDCVSLLRRLEVIK